MSENMELRMIERSITNKKIEIKLLPIFRITMG